MRTVLNWFGIAAVIVVALVIFVVAVTYIYNPRAHFAWVKPGIAQRKIPAGVDASVVFENVNVIPMDSERVLEGQSVAIEDHRIAGIGNSGDIDIPADAHVVDGEGRFLVPGLSDMIVHTDGSENDLLVYLANGVTTIRIMGEDPPAILEWRDQIKAGTRAGPNIWVWWPQYVHPGVFDGQGWGPGANRYVEFGTGYLEYLADHEKMLLALYESGALLMSGTDVPVPLMVPGFSLHDEFETMADIGLSAYDVLRTSTYNPAPLSR